MFGQGGFLGVAHPHIPIFIMQSRNQYRVKEAAIISVMGKIHIILQEGSGYVWFGRIGQREMKKCCN